jgi:glycosyltransferase involved in cell wall biosynthesis
MTKLVSVLLPVYNVENYISDSLNSLLNQSYRNLEIIVVDDASTDRTYQLITEISKIDCRIKIFRNNVNLRIAETLNIAFKLSRGEYILRMDGDDICHCNRLKIQYDFLENNPLFDLVGIDCFTINEEGDIIGETNMIHNPVLLLKTLKLASPVLHIWLARRSVYEKLNGYRDIPGVEDYDFLLRMRTHNIHFTNIPFKGYSVRIREGNTATTSGLRQRALARYVVSLFNYRIKFGYDLHSSSKMEYYIKSSNIANYLYKVSHSYTVKAILAKNNHNYILTFIYLAISSMLSYRQLDYLARKLLLKFLCKISR